MSQKKYVKTVRRALENMHDAAIPKKADTTLHISFNESNFTNNGFSREEMAYAHLSIETEKNIFGKPI